MPEVARKHSVAVWSSAVTWPVRIMRREMNFGPYLLTVDLFFAGAQYPVP